METETNKRIKTMTKPQQFKQSIYFSLETKNINCGYKNHENYDEQLTNKHSIIIWQLNVNVQKDKDGVFNGGYEQYTLNTGDCERYTCYFCNKYDIDYATGSLNFNGNTLSSHDGHFGYLSKRIIKILQQNGFIVKNEKKLQSLYRINY